MIRLVGRLALLALCLAPASLHALPKDFDRFVEDVWKEWGQKGTPSISRSRFWTRRRAAWNRRDPGSYCDARARSGWSVSFCTRQFVISPT